MLRTFGNDTGTLGFGQQTSQKDDHIIPEGHMMTFKEAVHKLSVELVTAFIVPRWAMGINEKLRTTRLSIDEMHVRRSGRL